MWDQGPTTAFWSYAVVDFATRMAGLTVYNWIVASHLQRCCLHAIATAHRCVVCVVGESILGHGGTDQLLRSSTLVSRRPELAV